MGLHLEDIRRPNPKRSTQLTFPVQMLPDGIPLRTSRNDTLFFISEADVTMQQVTLCFCGTISFLLAMSSYVDAQQVVYISDANTNAVQKVSVTLLCVSTVFSTPRNRY